MILRRLAIVSGLAFGVALTNGACAAKDDRTQVTIVLTTETEIPKELDALELTVTAANGSVVYDNVYEVREPSFFATTLAVIPSDSDSLKRPFTVEVKGKSGATVGVFRRAIVSYVEGRTLMVPMPLRMACFNFKDCGATSTCRGGTCEPAELSSESLLDYDERYVFAPKDDETKCFDEEACLKNATPVTVNPDCTFRLPSSSPTLANVSIRWAAAPNRVIVLDQGDSVEGWTMSPQDPSLGLLSPGICKSLLDLETDPKKREVPDQALDARMSVGCSAKVATLPYCRRGDSKQNGIGALIESK